MRRVGVVAAHAAGERRRAGGSTTISTELSKKADAAPSSGSGRDHAAHRARSPRARRRAPRRGEQPDAADACPGWVDGRGGTGSVLKTSGDVTVGPPAEPASASKRVAEVAEQPERALHELRRGQRRQSASGSPGQLPVLVEAGEPMEPLAVVQLAEPDGARGTERVLPVARSGESGSVRGGRARRSTRARGGTRSRSSRARRAGRAPRSGRARRELAPLPPSRQPRWYTVIGPTASRCSGRLSSHAAARPAMPPPRIATRRGAGTAAVCQSRPVGRRVGSADSAGDASRHLVGELAEQLRRACRERTRACWARGPQARR